MLTREKRDEGGRREDGVNSVNSFGTDSKGD